MRCCKRSLLVFLAASAALSAQQTKIDSSESQYPLNIVIQSSQVPNVDLGARPLAEGEQRGVASPKVIVFKGTINGEDHWGFSCRRENQLYETNPCTDLPTTAYRGRWVHEHSEIQIVSKSPHIERFLDVFVVEKNPPDDDDAVYLNPTFDFNIPYPKKKSVKDYPILVHVYDSAALRVAVGQLPGRSDCTSKTSPVTNQTNTSCTTSSGQTISRDFVTLDASLDKVPFASLTCSVRLLWSRCEELLPGFYFARVDNMGRLMVLTEDSKKPKEIGFEVR